MTHIFKVFIVEQSTKKRPKEMLTSKFDGRIFDICKVEESMNYLRCVDFILLSYTHIERLDTEMIHFICKIFDAHFQFVQV